MMHSDLMTTSERYISLNSLLLFFWLFNLAGHSVSNSYYLLQWCSSTKLDIPIYIVWCLMSWFVAYMAQLAVLHIACNFAANQVIIVIIVIYCNCLTLGIIVCRRTA